MLQSVKDILIRPLGKNERIPYELLLDADPSMDAISKYLPSSDIYVALLEGSVIATFVLHPLDADTMEIKNIAVEEQLQNKGIGKLLLNKATQIAIDKGAKSIVIGTSNASVAQLYLYQANGFEITGIKHNFFPENYPEPIFENGIQCKHMLMLTKRVQ
jgi:ribosomal protein S18 acetylase RimI-like enzyme